MSTEDPFETLETFENIEDVCKEINRSLSNVYRAIRNGTILCGFYWDKFYTKPNTYKCHKCGEVKPFDLEHFANKPSNRFDLSHECKDCIKRLYGYRKAKV